jgi:hypothetical protein
MSRRITTVGMFRSGQLGLCCTVERNCSGMSAYLAVASVTHDHAFKTCEPNYVPGEVRPFFIPVVHSPLGVMGYVAAPELSSRGGRARSHGTSGDVRAHLDREARSRAEEYVTAPELSSRGRKAQGHVTAPEPTSAGRRGSELRNMWQRQSSTQQGGEAWGHGTCESTGAHLSRKARSETAGHVEVSELTWIGRRGPELQGMWQRVDARSASCLDLKLVCGGTRSTGYRQRPPGPPRERQ